MATSTIHPQLQGTYGARLPAFVAGPCLVATWLRLHRTTRISVMARRCELTGKAVLGGHLVSHSNRKTKRRFLPNLCSVTLQSEALGRSVRLRITAAALRSV